MSKTTSLLRYSLIISKLRRAPVLFEEIETGLATESDLQGYDLSVSKRTFQRDLNDIRSLFGIDIKFSHSQDAYYIDESGKSEVCARMLEAFDTFQALKISENTSQFIHFEKRKHPGTEHLFGILHAMKNRLRVKFTYQKFWQNSKTERLINPYALKEFKNRWYMVALDSKDELIKTFALDRLSGLQVTKKPFLYPTNFNIEDYYKNCFGIINSHDDKPLDIVLSFSPFQGKYIKSLALHESQKVVIDNEEELQISLKLYPTIDFIMEVLSFGARVKVIEPASLARTIGKELKSAELLYRNNP